MDKSTKKIYKEVKIQRHIFHEPRLLNLPLKVERIGFLHNKTEVIDRLFALPSICFVISGRGILQENGKKRQLRAPFVLWNLTGDRKSYTPLESWDELFIGFAPGSDKILTNIFPRDFFIPRVKHLSNPDESLNLIARLIEIISGNLQQENCAKIDIMVMELLLCALCPGKDKEQSRKEETLHKIVTFIEEHCCEDLDLKLTAEKFGLSYSTFQRYWKQKYPIPPRDYLHKLRNARAIELLSSPKYSIGEAAGLLGFKNQFYFSRFFHRANGLSPREWRKLHKINH